MAPAPSEPNALSTDTWKGRREVGRAAAEAIAEKFRADDWLVAEHGIEFDRACKAAIEGQYDRTAIMLRWRPDNVCALPGHRTLLCECKAAVEDHWWRKGSFHLEARAYLAGLEWNAGGQSAMLAWHAMSGEREGESWYTWPARIPPPAEIHVPRWRHDAARQLSIMRGLFPEADVEYSGHTGGSGTPLLYVPLECCDPLEDFLRTEAMWAAER